MTTRNYSRLAILALVHGGYYILTGIWPIFHIESFITITGPKTDLWLVKTVGVLIFFVGVGLLHAGLINKVSFSLILIAGGSALGFILIDVIYVVQRIISPVYLLDAIAELILLLSWTIIYSKNRFNRSPEV